MLYTYGSVTLYKWTEYKKIYKREYVRETIPTKTGKLQAAPFPHVCTVSCQSDELLLQFPSAYNKHCPLNSVKLTIIGADTNTENITVNT